MNLHTFMLFIGKMGILMLGILVIALITPKLASFIDNKRDKNPDPYHGVSNPARVQDNNTSKNSTAEGNPESDETKAENNS